MFQSLELSHLLSKTLLLSKHGSLRMVVQSLIFFADILNDDVTCKKFGEVRPTTWSSNRRAILNRLIDSQGKEKCVTHIGKEHFVVLYTQASPVWNFSGGSFNPRQKPANKG